MFEVLKDFVDWLVTQFWEIAETLFLALLSALPFPEWMSEVGPSMTTAVEYAAYPFWIAGFDVGLPIVVSAMGIRFFIRRIPGIG